MIIADKYNGIVEVVVVVIRERTFSNDETGVLGELTYTPVRPPEISISILI